MIRRPTSLAAQYAWWRAATNNRNPPRHEGYPECGWYQFRAVKNGPFLPAHIYLEQDIDPETRELQSPEIMRCDVLGQHRNPETIWTYLTPVSRQRFDELLALHGSVGQMTATHAALDIRQITHKPTTDKWRI